MPTFGPVKRDVLIRCLRKFGFDGPYSGGKHPFMVKGDLTLTIPNPHHKDIGREFWQEFYDKLESPRKNGKSFSPTLIRLGL
ncbi:MAG: type II toxin-antitoxin system HicA family toxin [Desulfobacterales bacterium]|nr:type II toxin-antitoxin system HicA family toxin [Desulfobacterales bacterium]